MLISIKLSKCGKNHLSVFLELMSRTEKYDLILDVFYSLIFLTFCGCNRHCLLL